MKTEMSYLLAWHPFSPPGSETMEVNKKYNPEAPNPASTEVKNNFERGQSVD